MRTKKGVKTARMTNKEEERRGRGEDGRKNKGLQRLVIINNLLLIYIFTHFESKYL